MPKHQKYSPKHRQAPAAGVPKKALRNTVLLSSVALTATGVAVGGGVVSADEDGTVGGAVSTVASDLGALDPLPPAEAEAAPRRDEQVSRSDRRDAADPAKEKALSVSATSGEAITRTEDLSDDDPRDIGRALLPEFGFAADQFGCLDSLYESESGWRIDADNPTSSAYGIPQALTQTHDLPDGYLTSAEVQIRWGLGYIQDRYGTPCNAWGFKQGNGWY
ncbi:aggregation-promoting factor C-terminal-like domain-containing protein [Nocardioides donggukensis]|uniref:Lytic transglycosylase domain-containing protein n=1 Tax=Nocardioides donggukensis TaxID=2774019 RepID=A0A927Q1Q6_9ACTN|nr:lytic transglycosylase domain-containing protein [Nocardioides donggukensis]MBD8870392.1 lytic transglycosylase domain-containing protein [Nocardioides donggukensis]